MRSDFPCPATASRVIALLALPPPPQQPHTTARTPSRPAATTPRRRRAGELRKKEPRQGLADWNDLPLPLFKFNTVEGFYKFWLRTPHITCVSPERPPSHWGLRGARHPCRSAAARPAHRCAACGAPRQ